MAYVKRSRKRNYRRKARGGARSSRKFTRKARSGTSFRRRGRRFGPSHIRIRESSLVVSYSKWYKKPSPLGIKIRKQYWAGQKNIWHNDSLGKLVGQIGNSNNQQSFQVNSFSATDMINAISNLGIGSFGAAGSRANTARYFMNKVTNQITLTNSTNAPTAVDIYVFKVKRDTTVTFHTQWTRYLEDQGNSSGTDYTFYSGIKPTDCAGLMSYYETKAVYHLTLGPGQNHTHMQDHHLCMPICGELLASDGPGSIYLKGYTYVTYVIANGFPITTSDGAVFVANSPYAICWNVRQKYEVKYITDNDINEVWTYNTSYGTTGASSYNQGSGAAATTTGI